MDNAEARQLCYIPKGDCRVATHRLFEDIIDRVLGGWSPRAIQKWVASRQNPPNVTWEEIDHYVRQHIPKALLSAKAYLDRMPALRAVDINEIERIGQLAVAQSMRVSRLLEQEERAAEALNRPRKAGEEEAAQASPYNAGLRMEIQELRRLLVDSASLKLKTGMLEAAPQQVRFGPMQAPPAYPEAKVSEDHPELTPHERARVAAALHYVDERWLALPEHTIDAESRDADDE